MVPRAHYIPRASVQIQILSGTRSNLVALVLAACAWIDVSRDRREASTVAGFSLLSPDRSRRRGEGADAPLVPDRKSTETGARSLFLTGLARLHIMPARLCD